MIFPSDFNNPKYQDLFQQHGLMLGRMISGSKSGYRNRFPKHVVVFNANILTKEDGKIWHGDLDITLDRDQLNEIAKDLNKTLYILYESDARFGAENEPIQKLIGKAIWKTHQSKEKRVCFRCKKKVKVGILKEEKWCCDFDCYSLKKK